MDSVVGRRPFRPLVPSEHGTWGELLFPLAAGLAVGRPGSAAWLIAATAVLGFLSSESIQVLAGWRGARARRERRRDAHGSLALFAAPAAATAVLGWQAAGGDARLAAAAAIGLAALTWTVAFARGLKTGAGEFLAGAALAAWSAPVALAGGAPLDIAIGLAVLWTTAFGAATLAVRSLVARSTRRRGGAPAAAAVGLVAAAMLVVTGLVSRGALGPLVAAGFVPFAALVVIVSFAPLHARRLRAIGWTLVGASTLLLAALVLEAA
jgi:hypothetical protein